MPKKEIDLSELTKLMAEGPAGQEKLEKQRQAISNLQETLMLMIKRVRPYEIPVVSDENVIQFGLIGDTHIGSLYQRLDALKLFYNRCADEGITDILHVGDVVDGWKVYKGQEFELMPIAKSWPEQRNIFENDVPRINGMRTIFVTGTHDSSFKNLVGLIAGDELQRVRPDWKYIGQDVGTVILKTPGGQKFTVELLHPGGGTAYAVSYHAQKIIESLAGGQKPDLIAIGHYHKALYMPAYRNITCLLAGCFQSQTPYMVRKSLAAHIGGWIVRVTLGKRERLTSRVQAEFISFFEEQKA
jgi:hypothetical protein